MASRNSSRDSNPHATVRRVKERPYKLRAIRSFMISLVPA